ncbi:Adenosine deaminase-like protein [Fulvia fulva]|uniref:Adenosine deaminase-like protein n=1 Tax=Passalora fulva TaxID=5499 RepID=A0A9Q8PHV6_PASFU|nr:Adenosine deaminase-like protein [Fulvia fulva]KAK4616308.1 Adenosine deaminase-like protein [Fulvia fulva]KAK4616476.1 Adenosine deaminase-like protein [Fulvia fulva]UJO22806.1 Adenosine deaminase-like protein [Fulvia fulva]WPV19160.1 Adenosine deaminase-like protein [Fulvia fulva]WPV34205.1 Adenosine deaminase-like protein [Fulvia fulva]
MDTPADTSFTKALPKVELHAHLTGSITPHTLHEIWLKKRDISAGAQLEDPLTACRPEAAHHDVFSFFPLFDTYIYNLINDVDAVAFATGEVLKAFEADGVRYLELRTTPREEPATGLTKEVYVETVLDTIKSHSQDKMHTYLILSIDRRNTLAQAMDVVNLAIKYQSRGIVGVDLCGNPLKGNISLFAPAFAIAKSHNLRITLHFAELPSSSTEVELTTLLSYVPDRLGHVINTTPSIETEIEKRKLGLELCLSCNVLAGLTEGGYANHHFGKWYTRDCPIALCTDDFGVFGSSISNEYLLTAQHFQLSRSDLIWLASGAVPSIFGGEDEEDRMYGLLKEFEDQQGS